MKIKDSVNNTEGASKPLGKVDDSGAAFLIRSLGGDPGRNFDVDSIFYLRRDNKDSWIIFEFLKCDTFPVEKSHPNRYFDKNGRKFLSLWALCNSLRSQNMHADLYLINYDDACKNIKKMKVLSMGKNRVETQDEMMSFENWSNDFRKLNREKKGETWDLLEKLINPSDSSE